MGVPVPNHDIFMAILPFQALFSPTLSLFLWSFNLQKKNSSEEKTTPTFLTNKYVRVEELLLPADLPGSSPQPMPHPSASWDCCRQMELLKIILLHFGFYLILISNHISLLLKDMLQFKPCFLFTELWLIPLGRLVHPPHHLAVCTFLIISPNAVICLLSNHPHFLWNGNYWSLTLHFNSGIYCWITIPEHSSQVLLSKVSLLGFFLDTNKQNRRVLHIWNKILGFFPFVFRSLVFGSEVNAGSAQHISSALPELVFPVILRAGLISKAEHHEGETVIGVLLPHTAHPLPVMLIIYWSHSLLKLWTFFVIFH